MKPSFMSYDYRDPQDEWRREEQVKGWTRFILWMVVFLLGATIVNNLVSVSSAQEKEPTPIDDAYICSRVHEYPIAQHEAILEYCIGLMERGL